MQSNELKTFDMREYRLKSGERAKYCTGSRWYIKLYRTMWEEWADDGIGIMIS